MKTQTISTRNISCYYWKGLKAYAKANGITTYEALNQAIARLVKEEKFEARVTTKKIFKRKK